MNGPDPAKTVLTAPGASGAWQRAAGVDAGLVLGMMREFYAEEGLAFDEAAQGAALGAVLAQREEDAGEMPGAVFWLRCASGSAAESAAGRERSPATATVAGYLVLTWGYSLEFGGRFVVLDEVWVAPPWRGRGEGRRAVEFALEWARARGAKALRLEVAHENGRARALYARAGLVGQARDLLTRRLAGAAGDGQAGDLFPP